MSEHDQVRLLIFENGSGIVGGAAASQMAVGQTDATAADLDDAMEAPTVHDLGTVVVTGYAFDRRVSGKKIINLRSGPIAGVKNQIGVGQFCDKRGRQSFGHARHMGIGYDDKRKRPRQRRVSAQTDLGSHCAFNFSRRAARSFSGSFGQL